MCLAAILSLIPTIVIAYLIWTVGTVPQGFIDNYSVIDFFRLDPENPAIKANVKSLGGIYIENDQLVVETQIREDNAE